jgi:uncharacterized protein (TIGR02001 family)
VSARAAAPVASARASRTGIARFGLLCLLAGLAAAPASAGTGFAASIVSDARFRGYSLSEGRPVATLAFSNDDPLGFYLGGSASAVLRHNGEPAPYALQLDAGYGTQIGRETTLDVGITHTSFTHYSSRSRGTSYTEVYAGIIHGGLSSTIYLSPDYFMRGRWTAYGEVNGNVSLGSNWSLDGHVGALAGLRTPVSTQVNRPGVDWSAGVTRQFGRISLHAKWSDGLPGHDFYDRRRHSRSAVVVGASLVL